MANGPENLEDRESPESKASEELSKLGIQCIPENIQTVIDLQKTLQHPEGFEEIFENIDSPEEIGRSMKEI